MFLKNLQHQLVLNAPKWLRFPVALIPFSMKKKVMLSVMAHVFKEALEDGDFEFLSDRFLKVAVTDLELACFITFENEQLVILEKSEQVDVSFSAGLNDLILIAGRKEDPDSLFFQRRLRIEGDTELGLEVKNLIDSIDLDVLPSILKAGLTDLAIFVHQGLAQPEVTSTQAMVR